VEPTDALVLDDYGTKAAFSISRCAVMPTTFRNFRTELLNLSSSICAHLYAVRGLNRGAVERRTPSLEEPLGWIS